MADRQPAPAMVYRVTCNHEVDPVAKKEELMGLVRAAGFEIYHSSPLRRHFSFRVPKGYANPLANRLDEFTYIQETELKICNETAEEAEQVPEARPNQNAA